MKQQKLLFIAIVVVGLMVVGAGAAAAQGSYGAGPDECVNQPESCTSLMQRDGMGAQGQHGWQQPGAQGQPGVTRHSGWRHQAGSQDGAVMSRETRQSGRSGNANGGRANGGMRGAPRGQGPASNVANWTASLPPKVEGELADEVVAAMKSGIADEQNAYATYAAIVEQFGAVRPFVNIQRAEAQHTAAWEFLFDRYGVPVPEAGGVNVAQYASLAEACQTAVDAETANIGLYDNMLATLKEYPDMLQVVTRLRDASQLRHLPAFERCSELSPNHGA